MNEVTRRGLLGAGVAGAVAGILGQAPAAEAARRRKRPRRKENPYARRRYARMVGRRFKLVGATSAAGLRLIRVGDLPSGRVGDTRCFSLTFRTARPGPPQGTYTLRRRGFAPTELFIVPADANRRTYQAVINRAR
jgi:hypothetical protein